MKQKHLVYYICKYKDIFLSRMLQLKFAFFLCLKMIRISDIMEELLMNDMITCKACVTDFFWLGMECGGGVSTLDFKKIHNSRRLGLLIKTWKNVFWQIYLFFFLVNMANVIRKM